MGVVLDCYSVGILQVERDSDICGSVQSLENFCRLEEICSQEEQCCHQYEVSVVMTARTPDSLLQLGAVVGEDWVWGSLDPWHIPVYCGGQRLREVLSVRTGAIGTLVSQQCVLCLPSDSVFLHPALLWFGWGSHAPCVRAAPGTVVGEGVVWLEEDRRAWCEGVGEVDRLIYSRVINNDPNI